MAADRQPAMRRMIMAPDEAGRRAALDELQPLQQADFEGLFEAMAGLPVTIRLLDPPLHEFLPDRLDLVERLTEARLRGAPEAPTLELELDRARALEEDNPMLGTRGVRLGLVHPEIYEMQTRAIFRAARAVRDRGAEPVELEVMVPLVAYPRELQLCRQLVERVAAEEGFAATDDFRVGTMIELPRACLRAAELAPLADFFSFGTNDLTQTTLGFSRDDIEGRIVGPYIDAGVLERSPFGSIDETGVGELVSVAAERGRAVDADLTLGVCGEHGGDPDSIRFFHAIGLDYVSCSPFRLPVARVAAAQAALALAEHPA
jgi:pyruvate,orthophosphate dikinase